MTVRTWLWRALAVGGAGTVAALALAAPASAHVEVSADKAQAGAADVTVTFSAEAESSSSGIASVRVVLPAGIAPDQVSWVSGPNGWALSPAADGYTVAGPALPTGKAAEYAVKVAKLPAGATTLPFKTLVTYGDGHVDRWIEVPAPGAKSENPAPQLTLAPAAPGTGGGAPASAAPAPTTSAAPATPTQTVDQGAKASDGGSPTWPIVLGVVVLIAALGGYLWYSRRRSARP